MKQVGLGVMLLVIFLQLPAQDISIDLNDVKQTITGFGGAHSPEWGVELTNGQIDKIFGNAPGQVGLTILRVPVPTDSTMFPIELPGAVRATENGAIVFASPWSPPAYMKTNSSTVQGKLDTAFYDEFALYLDSFATYMAENGAPLYAVSLQNEPDWLPTYTSCGWAPADFVNFLSKSGAKITATKVLVSESLNFNHDYTDPILNSPEAEPHVDIMGGHLYGTGGIQDYPLARDKGKEVWMTEHYLNGTNYAVDMATAKEIHDCMVVNYNAYVYWYAINETGFLSVGGDILKRGYVMSQYAKFIRPGSVRVGVTGVVTNVDVTAYINDTNLVVVALNRNSVPVSLDFEIQNGDDYHFTKFVTSETKNVYNDSIITTSGSAFTILLDAMSVTTLTTIPDQGGRRENILPVANAGVDSTITDENGDGFELFTLDGSASSDEDGSVSMFTWSEAGNEIAAGMKPEISIGTGVHKILLTITDSDGGISTDSVIITVNLPAWQTEVHLWFEAECGNVGDRWDILTSDNASNGIYLEIQPENNSTASASEDSTDHVVFSFEVPDSGEYAVWVRCRVPSADDDSYWIKMDDGDWTMWNGIHGGSTFQWDIAPNGANSTYPLLAGVHLFTMAYREDGAEMDKIYITNTGTVPTGFGEDALVCTGVLRPTANAGPNQNIIVAESSDLAMVTLDGSSSSDADGAIVNYVWTLADTVLATGVDPTIELPVGNHRITLTVTDDYSGMDDDEVLINVNIVTGIFTQQEETGFSYTIYPNPFSDNLKIDYTLDETKVVKIELTDISGRTVSTILNSTVDPGNYSLNIDGNQFKQGVYFVTVHIGSEFSKFSLVVKE
jgi:O-glycosyl hydrolase